MRVLSIIVSIMIFFSCSTTPIKEKKEVNFKDSKNITTDIKNFKGKNYLIIEDSKTKKKWVIEYEQWKQLNQSYTFWNTVTNNKPKILNIKEEDGYININFSYTMVDDSKLVKKEKTILAGYVHVPKKYINEDVKKQLDVYRGAVIGTGTYAGLTTLLVVILLIILL